MTEPGIAVYACMPRARVAHGVYSVAAVQPEHIESIRQWRNAQMSVLRQSAEITADQQRRYYAERVWPELSSPRPTNLLLAFLEGEALIGYGGLVHVAWEHRRAEVSFLLDPERVRYADVYARDFAAFLRLLQVVAFDDLALRRLFTETYAFREEHMGILEAVGFRREGVLRQHVWIDRKPVDSVIHGLVKAAESGDQ